MTAVFEASDILQPPLGGPALGRIPAMEITHSAADSESYMLALGLFGTAGNPDEVYDWRADTLPVIEGTLALRGLSERVGIFNPLKRDWRPEDAAIEAQHCSRWRCDSTGT